MHENENIFKLITFKLGKIIFGMEIIDIREIIRILQVVPVPKSPESVEGVINLRGTIVPVINLKTRLRMEEEKGAQEILKKRIMIIDAINLQLGLIVDEILKVLNIEACFYEVPPQKIFGIDQLYLKGLIKHENSVILLLDSEQILTGDEHSSLKKIQYG